MNTDSTLLEAGKIVGVFGIKGWVKVLSFTEPTENLFEYHPWLLRSRRGEQAVEVESFKPHKTGWLVLLKGMQDRNAAEALGPCRIFVNKDQLAALDDGDYYWHQLVGLRVRSADRSTDFGVVKEILETGANDVLVVGPDGESIDDQERLIPYVPERYVLKVDLQVGELLVDWHVDY